MPAQGLARPSRTWPLDRLQRLPTRRNIDLLVTANTGPTRTFRAEIDLLVTAGTGPTITFRTDIDQ